MNPDPQPVRRRSPLLAGIIAIASAAPLLVMAAARPEEFRFLRALTPPPGERAAIGSVELDEPVLAATDDAYSALRLFDGLDQETPAVVRPRRAERTVLTEYEVACARERFNLLPDNRIEVVLRIEESAPTLAAVAIETPLDNFEKSVSIWGGADGANWSVLVEAQPIYDYTRFMAVRSVRVPLPPGTAGRYLRLVIDNITEAQRSPLTHIDWDRRNGAVASEVERATFQRQDFRIDRLLLIGTRSVRLPDQLIKRAYTPADVRVAHDSGQRCTTVSFDSPRAPVTDITLVTAVPNFSRTVTVEGTDDPAQGWRRVGAGSVTRFRAGPYRQEHLTLELPAAVRCRHYRLTINNLDSPPLTIDGVNLRGETHEVLFFPQPGSAYRLAYDATGLAAPVYDVAEALRRAPPAETTAWTLTAPVERTPGAHRRPDWWNSRRILTGAIVLVVLALAGVLARTARRIPGASDV